jgi:C-terminal processing protease CtpA/Prc
MQAREQQAQEYMARGWPTAAMASVALAAAFGCRSTPAPSAPAAVAGAADGDVLQRRVRETYPSLLYVDRYRRRFPEEVQQAPAFWSPGATAPSVATPDQLTRALTALADQHVALVGPLAGGAETPGVLFRTSTDNDMIVWRVFDPAASTAREGDRVLAIDGVPTKRWLDRAAAVTFGGNRRGRAGEAATELGIATRVVHRVAGLGETVSLRVEAAGDSPRTISLTFLPMNADRARAMTSAINRADLAEVIPGTGIGTLRIGAFAPQYDPVYLAAEEQASAQPGATDDQVMLTGYCAVTRAFIARFESVARSSEVMVIDIRGNLGGFDRIARLEADAIAPVPSPATFDLFAGGKPGGVRLAEEHRDPSCGHASVTRPIVVLDDAQTRSAGEFFAAWLWASGARVIGERTVGAGGGYELDASGFTLPGSGLGVRMSANFTIFDPAGAFKDGEWSEAALVGTITDDDFKPGRGKPFAIQAVGLAPDVVLTTTLADLRDAGAGQIRAALSSGTAARPRR